MKPLPSVDDLEQAGCDAVLVFGGDGTIAAAATALEAWAGRCIVLPGGTMNMLAKTLHGDTGWADIVSSVTPDAAAISLPYVEAGGRRAFVAMIAGPVTAWVHPREAVRAGRFASLRRGLVLAWRRTFSEGVRVIGTGTGRRRHQAVIIMPQAEALEVATVDARSIGQIIALGWRWLRDDWRQAPGVTSTGAAQVTLWARRRITALMDGEEVILEPPALVRHGTTRLRFVALAEGAP